MTDVGGLALVLPTPINRQRSAHQDVAAWTSTRSHQLIPPLVVVVTDRAGLTSSISVSNAAGPRH